MFYYLFSISFPREEVEQQMIQTSKKRLVRIEDDNINKVRLRRSTSLSETSFESGEKSYSMGVNSVFRSISGPSSIETVPRDLAGVRITDEIIEELIDDDDTNDKSVLENNDISDDWMNTEKGYRGQTMVDGALANGVDWTVGDVPDSGACVQMSLDSDTLTQLEEMFGRIIGRQQGTFIRGFLPI